MPIKTKLILLIIGVLVFAGSFMGFVIFEQNSLKLAEHSNADIKETINYTFQIINSYLNQVQNSLARVATDPQIINALEQTDPLKLLAVSEKLTDINDAASDIENIVLYSVSGSSCIAQTANKESLAAVGRDFKERDYCRGIIKNKAPYFSSTYIGSVTNKPVLSLTIPIKNNRGEMLGFVMGTISVSELRGYLWDLQENSSVVLLDRYGAPFLDTQKNIVKLDNPLTAPESEVQKRLAANQKEGYFQNQNNFVGYKFNGALTVIYEKSTADLTALTNNINLTVFWALLISAFFTAFIILFFIGKITKRINRLSALTQQLAAGKFNIKIKKQDLEIKDEIGVLAKSFNKMAGELQELTQGLESKVNEKTKALSNSLLKITKNNQLLEDNKKAMLNLLEDIEKEKETAHAEKNKAETILYSIGDGVLVIDNNYKVLVFNEVAAKISGFSIKEAVGKRYDQVLKFVYEENGDNKERINNEFIKKVITTGQISKMANHTVLIAKDGTKIPVGDSAAPLKDKNGKVIGCVVVFRDVTKERQIDQMKTEFVSVASHQLRTPLTGIKWFSELLLKNKLNPKEKDYVEQINVSNERMIQLVNDLLNVSRIEKGRKFDIVLQKMDIAPVIAQIVNDQKRLASAKKIRIEFSKAWPRQIMLLADPEKMRQVFQNLIDNAIKYSKPGGKIELDCQKSEQEVTFSVKDSGIGIPSKQQPRVFERFFRADNALTHHTDGTGLGLYIVKAIIEGHKGKIWFESEEGKGSTFYFTLPVK